MGTILIKVRNMESKPRNEVKFKDGYYFRIDEDTKSEVERDRLDSMVIVSNGRVAYFFDVFAKEWWEPKDFNFIASHWHYEFMGEL